MDSTASAPLGITTKLGGGYGSTGRLEKYRLQALARVAVPNERVAGCLRTVVHGSGGPTIWHEEAKKRAKYGGLMVCGSAWMCPVCASHISERRRAGLADLVAKGRALQISPTLVTLTFSHGSKLRLSDSVELMLKAYQRMREHYGYRALRRYYGTIGFVKALEVTWGADNGWHPHMHVLMFNGRYEESPGMLGMQLADSWLQALESVGLSGTWDRAVKVQPADDKVAEYVAKYGREPEKRPWSTEDELTKWHVKRAGSKNDVEGRYSPFDLLRWYGATKDPEPLELFREYAAVFKGRHQLQVSRGLKALLSSDLTMDNEQAASFIEPDAVKLAILTAVEWDLVKKYELRGELLEAAGMDGFDGLMRFLDDLRHRDR